MSMPSFPPCGADMTKDEALTMIIASIAMEELAFSHIVNAEGEKLQYVLGTLPDSPKVCASPQEILEVNKSVKELLDTVMQNQMLLKGKLEKALDAGGHAPAPAPCPPQPPCHGECGRKSAIQLVSQCDHFSWGNGFLMPWKCQGRMGHGIHWDESAPALVRLEPHKAYALSYTIDVCAPQSGDGRGSILVNLTPGDAFSGALPLHFSWRGQAGAPMTLHGSAVLFPSACLEGCADLSLLLDYCGCLYVTQACMSIVEI